MIGRKAAGLLLVALGVAACDTTDPTGVAPVETEQTEITAERGGNSAAAMDRGALLTGIPVEVDGLQDATLSITDITRNENGDSDLLVDGILRGTHDGVEVTEIFTDVAGALRQGTSGEAAGDFMVLQDRSPNESGACDILFLDLGPIFLDLLGLQVDLSQIVLDVDAVSGSGNLLGNLLCAVTGLLDDGPLAAIDNLLDQINTILDNLTGLLEEVPITGTLTDGGVLEGTLTLTELALDEAGNLVGSGTLRGTTNRNGVLTEITQTFENVVLSLSETVAADGSGMVMAMAPGDRAANEEGVCDILFLEVGPIFLDLLGLTVDLSQIELDVDAQRGEGNLLGNLLCAVVGLLDGGGLDALNNLLDRINNLLG